MSEEMKTAENPAEQTAVQTSDKADSMKNERFGNDSIERDTGHGNRKIVGVIVRYGANLFLPLACTFGGYVVLHGDSSPGGGFQGGVLIASAVLLVFLGYGSRKLSTTFKESFLHSSETAAEVMYITIGLIGMIVGLDFAANFMIDRFHIETAVIMNNAVGYHVMAGVGCLLIMMLGMLSTSENEDEEGEK